MLKYDFSERKILYDYGIFGDSPICLNEEPDISDKVATLQGIGRTDTTDHVSEIILETQVITMTNKECNEWLKFNGTEFSRTQVASHFPLGINEQILCTRGILNEDTGIFSVTSGVYELTVDFGYQKVICQIKFEFY